MQEEGQARVGPPAHLPAPQERAAAQREGICLILRCAESHRPGSADRMPSREEPQSISQRKHSLGIREDRQRALRSLLLIQLVSHRQMSHVEKASDSKAGSVKDLKYWQVLMVLRSVYKIKSV